VPLRSSCQINDVPTGATTSGNFVNDINNGTLPNCSFVTPDMCNSTHDCSVGTGDAFLQTWVSKIMAGPTTNAATVIIITWDESGGGATQAEIVISPRTHGIKTTSALDHYARLRALEDLFSLPYLRQSPDSRAG
jgi:phospholipase C